MPTESRLGSTNDCAAIFPVPRRVGTKKHYELMNSYACIAIFCTSFSGGCFALHKWAVVALQNVLEGNEANQELVEKS
jgi:hypothetical protein